MPPKGSGRTARQSRGGQSGRAGRGRGRGARAGAAVSTRSALDGQDDAPDSGVAVSDVPNEPSGQSSDPIPVSTTSNTATMAAVAAVEPISSQTASPQPPSAQPASSVRGTSSTRGAKFRPKGVRRSEAERERIIQEQESIINQKLAEDARQRSRANRLRAGRGRGRGRGRGGPIATMAAGPLSMGSGFSSSGGGYGVASSYRNSSGTHDGGGGMGSDSKVKGARSGEASYGSLRDEYDNRINADQLYRRYEHSAEGEHIPAAHLMPMGIPRIEHKEEEVVMATAAEIEAREHGDQQEEESDEEDMWVDNPAGAKIEMVKDEEVWEHAAPKPTGPVKVKRPDGAIIETMDIDEIASGEVIHDDKKPSRVSATRKQKKQAPRKDLEDEYLADVLDRNLKVFGPQDDETEVKGEPHPREGKIFLFQLPPILPPLVAKKKEPKPNPVKAEPNDEVVMLDVPAEVPGNVDLTQEDDQEAQEGKEAIEDTRTKQEKRQQEGREWPANGGYLGKLVVRKSGNIELDYGGLRMAVEAAIPVSFIRSAVLVSHNDTKPDLEDSSRFDGTAYGMGRIEEKFCCAPIFSPAESWIIDPKDLEPPTDE